MKFKDKKFKVIFISVVFGALVLSAGWFFSAKMTLEIAPGQKSFRINEPVHLTLELKNPRWGNLGASLLSGRIARAAGESDLSVKIYDPAGKESPVEFKAEEKGKNNFEVTLEPPAGKPPHGDWEIKAKLNQNSEIYEANQTFNWGGNEVPEKRTYTSKTYDNHDGTFTLEAHTGQIHYKDRETEELRNIDTTLKDQGDKWTMEKASYHSEIPKFADQPMVFQDVFKEKNQTITMIPQTEHIQGEIENGDGWENQRVRYKNAFGENIDLRVTVGDSGLFKEVIVNEKPKEAKDMAFEFQIILPEGKSVFAESDATQKITKLTNLDNFELTGENQLLIGAEGGDENAYSRIQKIRVWDSTGNETNGKLRFYQKDGKIHPHTQKNTSSDDNSSSSDLGVGVNFQKIIPKEFLQSAVYPVYTDDTQTYYSGVGDGTVNNSASVGTPWEDARTVTAGTLADFGSFSSYSPRTGKQSLSNFVIRRAFFPIDTSAIPADAIISSATFSIYVSDKTNGYNDGDDDDKITLVQTSQTSETTLDVDQFNNCGAVTNPQEGIDNSERKDITTITTGQDLTFNLNSTGIGWIKKAGQTRTCGATNGYTCLGARVVEDVLSNHQYLGGNNTFNSIESNFYGSGNPPYLSVTYHFYEFTQTAYRLFSNADSTTAGSPLAAQDTAARLNSPGEAFRLRMLSHLGSGSANLPQAGWETKTVLGHNDDEGVSIASPDGVNVYMSFCASSFVNFARSTDGGKNWSVTNTGNQCQPPNTSITAPDEDHIYIAYTYNVYARILKSTDGGLSWSTYNIEQAPSGAPNGIISISYVSDNPDKLFTSYVYNLYYLRYCKSTDGGLTWLTCGNVYNGSFSGHEKITIAAPGSSRVYIGFVDDDTSHVNFALSTDGGASWDIKTVSSNGYETSSMFALDTDNVFMSYENSSALVFAKSSNGGQTWPTKVTVENLGGLMYTLSSISALDINNIYISYINSSSNLRVAKSTDGGATWSIDTVNGGLNEYTSLRALDSSNILVGFYDYTNNAYKFAKYTFQSFQLQFVGKGTGTCVSPSGVPSAWTDVGSSTAVAFKNNPAPADGAALSSRTDDPADGYTAVNQTYEESNSFNSSQGIIYANQSGKWDFSLYDNGMAPGASYCFRMIDFGGDSVYTYSVYPEVISAYLNAQFQGIINFQGNVNIK
jgi:photosystem II stability/assembly factor-like uncharacterized protein